jgi:chorismate mutase/prephenate dehydratase
VLKDLRRQIDEIDQEILALLTRRAEIALKVGETKRKEGLPLFIPGREENVFKRLIEMNHGPFPSRSVELVFREIVSACLAIQHPVRVAFLGPEATFTHQAGAEYFGLGVEYIPIKYVDGIFEAVERGQVDFGVVPFENSTEGVVSHTLDMFLSSQVKICGEVYLQVTHNLLSLSGSLKDVEVIYSHPHATAQCRKWITSTLPRVRIVDMPSTAEAALRAKEDSKGAAIASEMAAGLYGLKITARKIEDLSENYTRFLVLGMEGDRPTGHDKTSLLVSISDEVGALHKILQGFAEHGINLTKIESRPSRLRPWDYVFFIDLEGHCDDEKVSNALSYVEKHSLAIKVLGSYPVKRPKDP